LTPPNAPPPGIGPNGEPKFEVLADGDDDPSNDGQYGQDLIFGNTILGSIHGFKFEDYNGDGLYNTEFDDGPFLSGDDLVNNIDNDGDGFINEFSDALPDRPGHQKTRDLPWANFPFEITGDSDGDGVNDTWIINTNSDGEFWAEDLYPGEYTIRERLEDVHPDVRPSTHSSGQYTVGVWSGEELVWRPGAAMLEPNDPQIEKDDPLLAFGNSYLGSIHGCVFEDSNGDGIHESSEGVIPGISVTVWNSNSAGDLLSVRDTATSDFPNAFYWFEDLFPGWYAITANPAGGAITTPNPIVLFVGSREEFVHRDGAAHLEAGDPQHEVNVGAGTLIGISPPAAAAAAIGDNDAVDGAFGDVGNATTQEGNLGTMRRGDLNLNVKERSSYAVDVAVASLSDGDSRISDIDDVFGEYDFQSGLFRA
jgi:hypothetical protein